jgi:hypothetical protein
MSVRLAFIAAAFGLLAACTDTSAGSEAADDASDAALTPAPTDGFEVIDGSLDPADEVTEGDGWELLGSGERMENLRTLVLVTDPSELEGVWATHGMDGDPPSVDDEQAVVFVTVPTTCAFVLRDVVVDPDAGDGSPATVTELDLQAQVDGTCGDDTDITGRDLALAVDRELVDDRRVAIVRGEVPVGAVPQP